MRTSGLVLDIYDDFQGQVLRSIYPTQDDIPDNIKTAQVLSSEDREALPDDAFALVLLNGDQKFRKFACTDEGNTSLSVQYFLKNAHKLPVEAQKTAAANLSLACGWYDLEVPPELEKVAVGLDAALSLASGAGEVVSGVKDMGRGLANAKSLGSQMNSDVMLKKADVTGTTSMPNQTPTNKNPSTLATVQKSAEALETNESMKHKERPDSLPQAKAMTPHVDVSNKEAPKKVTEKTASSFALPSKGKYPLDSYEQVKEASTYFDIYWKGFTPAERHEFCTNMVKRAEALDLPVSDQALRYGSETYAPEEELKVAYEMRYQTVKQHPEAVKLLQGLFEKRAEIEPALFAETLGEFDKVASIDFEWDRSIPDPFYSTFGTEKTSNAWSFILGNEMVTEANLRKLSLGCGKDLKHRFNAEFVERFRKNPVGTFEALPKAQKKIVMRMASAAA